MEWITSLNSVVNNSHHQSSSTLLVGQSPVHIKPNQAKPKTTKNVAEKAVNLRFDAIKDRMVHQPASSDSRVSHMARVSFVLLIDSSDPLQILAGSR